MSALQQQSQPEIRSFNAGNMKFCDLQEPRIQIPEFRPDDTPFQRIQLATNALIQLSQPGGNFSDKLAFISTWATLGLKNDEPQTRPLKPQYDSVANSFRALSDDHKLLALEIACREYAWLFCKVSPYFKDGVTRIVAGTYFVGSNQQSLAAAVNLEYAQQKLHEGAAKEAVLLPFCYPKISSDGVSEITKSLALPKGMYPYEADNSMYEWQLNRGKRPIEGRINKNLRYIEKIFIYQWVNFALLHLNEIGGFSLPLEEVRIKINDPK